MPLRSPNLDDRNFRDLLHEAMSYAENSSSWKPSNPGDPGTVLLELFAYLTDLLMYRVNRLPEKVYVELLRLIGVQQQSQTAAITRLQFSLKEAQQSAITIPENTRVGAEGSSAEFITLKDVEISAGDLSIDVTAIHAQWFGFQAIGEGTGKAGLQLRLPHGSVIAPSPERIDLIIGVEAMEDDFDNQRDRYVHEDNRIYRIWREVESFSGFSESDYVYMADRANGTISFAPALQGEEKSTGQLSVRAIAAVPPASRNIIARYRTGGGEDGNLPPECLTKLLDKPKGFLGKVTNPERATGGSAIESLEHALVRGPQELHSLQRAVTARDFELLANKHSGLVNRAHAYTKRSHWGHASAGTVEVLLVPQVFGDQGPVTPEVLGNNENEEVLQQIQLDLDKRKPLGSTCNVAWCRYKTVKACVSLKVHREENRESVKQRITERLHQMINPLDVDYDKPGWPFGQALGAYHIYRILSNEPGIKTVDPVVLKVNDVPAENVRFVTPDAWQKNTWHAASASSLYRSLNNASGWELVQHWQEEEITAVKCFPKENQVTADVAGLVAVVSRSYKNADNTALYLSRDCGESWERVRKPDFSINDIAWIEINGRASLLIATEKGLFIQSTQTQKEWKPILIDKKNQSLEVRAVIVATNQNGTNGIAVSTPPESGVFLSMNSGHSFKSIGLKNKIVDVLKIQYRDTQRYLWAGFAAIGSDPGEGCVRWQLQESGESAEGWKTFAAGWNAGACTSLDFIEGQVFAGSRRMGVLRLDSDKDHSRWQQPNVNCGLAMERLGEFEAVHTIARGMDRDEQNCLLAGGDKGIYRSYDEGDTYENCSVAEFNDFVTLPSTWLFCSGEHEVEVEYDD